jgi:hypothetical protein
MAAQGNERRDVRIRYQAPVNLLWDDQYAKAVSSEVSERGLSLETSQSVPVGTHVALRSESGELLGGALVKHCTQSGSIYVVGVEFGYSLLDDALALVREVYSSPHAK